MTENPIVQTVYERTFTLPGNHDVGLTPIECTLNVRRHMASGIQWAGLTLNVDEKRASIVMSFALEDLDTLSGYLDKAIVAATEPTFKALPGPTSTPTST